MNIDNRAANRAKLTELIRKNPLATHIYFRRDDDVLVDVPLVQAEFTIGHRPGWLVDASAGGEVRTFAEEQKPVELPPKPSEEASAGGQIGPAPVQTPAIVDTPAEKFKYKALKAFEYPEGTKHKKSAELELTEAEAASFQPGFIKKT